MWHWSLSHGGSVLCGDAGARAPSTWCSCTTGRLPAVATDGQPWKSIAEARHRPKGHGLEAAPLPLKFHRRAISPLVTPYGEGDRGTQYRNRAMSGSIPTPLCGGRGGQALLATLPTVPLPIFLCQRAGWDQASPETAGRRPQPYQPHPQTTVWSAARCPQCSRRQLRQGCSCNATWAAGCPGHNAVTTAIQGWPQCHPTVIATDVWAPSWEPRAPAGDREAAETTEPRPGGGTEALLTGRRPPLPQEAPGLSAGPGLGSGWGAVRSNIFGKNKYKGNTFKSLK